jgi:hypothetical protein
VLEAVFSGGSATSAGKNFLAFLKASVQLSSAHSGGTDPHPKGFRVKKRTSPRFAFRRLLAEQLETRTVMDASGGHNSELLGDVNLDGAVNAIDTATISSFLTFHASTQMAVTPGTCMSNGIFPDANGDWLVNDDDVEFVNGLFGNTAQSNYNGEGGSSSLEGEGSGSGSSTGSSGGSSSSGGASSSGSGSGSSSGTGSGSTSGYGTGSGSGSGSGSDTGSGTGSGSGCR